MPVIQYKCPNCGSDMRFDSASGMLSCASCGRKDNVEFVEDPLLRATFEEDEARQYHCNSCGAVILTEPETSATVCSFCGSAVALGDRLTGELAPVKVIPFKIGKQEAIAAFKKWCKNGLMTPRGFMTADRIKSITGIYVPFWLYDLQTHVEASGNGTRVKSYRRGEYRITETQHFDVYRKLRLHYVHVPVDAAEKMKDELMDRLEPFTFKELKRFNTAYLAGYVAEKYSFDEQQMVSRARVKVAPYIEQALSGTVGSYSSISFPSKQVYTKVQRADYILLPVWIVHYDFDRMEHTFAMNGQTGKVVGKPPISKAKVAGYGALFVGGGFIAMRALQWMMGGGLW